MDEEKSKGPSPLRFVEVKCKSSGKISRFAAGTKAGFALTAINQLLDSKSQFGWFVEAVKEGEEPIRFGPDATLVDYGHGWTLQTFNGPDSHGSVPFQTFPKKSPPGLTSIHLGRVVVAFILMFLLAAIFTIFLENLPFILNSAKAIVFPE